MSSQQYEQLAKQFLKQNQGEIEQQLGEWYAYTQLLKLQFEATIIAAGAITDASIGTTAYCQLNNAKYIIKNIKYDKNLYKYIPALIFPREYSPSITQNNQVYQLLTTPTNRDINKASQLQSTILRHGLVIKVNDVNTPNNETRTVFMFIGGIPPYMNYTYAYNVVQGGALFYSKRYKALFDKYGINVNPNLGIIPLVGGKEYYSANPEICAQYPCNYYSAELSIETMYNFMASSLSAILQSTSSSEPYNEQLRLRAVVAQGLQAYSNAGFVSPTPVLHENALGDIRIGPSFPDSTNVNSDLNLYFDKQNLSLVQFNQSIIGAPIYGSGIGEGVQCTSPVLRGFVQGMDIVTGKWQIGNIVVFPGFMILNVVPPPKSYSFADVIAWAKNYMGIQDENFFKEWIMFVLFEQDVINGLVKRGYDFLVDEVAKYLDPTYETIEQGAEKVVNGIVNAVSGGINNVINFLKSL